MNLFTVISFLSRLLLTAGPRRFRAKDARQLICRRYLQLIVAAVLGTFVESPAQEMRGVAEARALHVVVAHFADALGPQRLPAQVLARIPAALPARHALSLAHR